MYLTIHNHPFPEFATLEKTFIPEPLPPCDDEVIVALLPLDHGSIVMSVTDNDDLEYVYDTAQQRGLEKEHIDWTLVDREAFMAIVIPHLIQYMENELRQAIPEVLKEPNN